MHDNRPDFVLKEMAFVEQRALFDRLYDDLLENPQGIVEAQFNAVGFPTSRRHSVGSRKDAMKSAGITAAHGTPTCAIQTD